MLNKTKITNANINYETGDVLLTNALGAKDKLTINFCFDVEVRFASDSFKYHYGNDGSIILDHIELIEVLN